MPIYDIDGNQLTHAYDIDGNELSIAYDIDGNVIFTKTQPLNINLKVMTYNVGNWYIGTNTCPPYAKDEEYYALHNGSIGGANADILCINEYWDLFSRKGRTALSLLEQYYPYIETRNGDTDYYGRAICSKYPITDYTMHQFTNTTNKKRYYDSCTVTVNGTPITVCVTHLDTGAANRANEVIELKNYLLTLNRFICCGDLNTINCASTSGSDYIAIIKPLLDAGFNLANCSDLGFLQTYGNVNSSDTYYTRALDNIITSSNIRIVSAEVDRTKETDEIDDKVDHMPLIAELLVI